MHVQEQNPLHIYFTIIPNIIYSLGLDVYELAVYSLMKRVAGEKGSCFMSVEQMAKTLKCSTRQIQNVKRSLSRPFNLLDGLSLITITRRKRENGSDSTDHVMIADIWGINMRELSTKKTENSQEKGGCTTCTPPVHHMHPHKKNNFKKNIKQQQGTKTPPMEKTLKKSAAAEAVVVFKCLEKIEIPQNEKEKLCKKFDEKTVLKALAFATHPKTEIKTTLLQVLKWACKEKPELPAPNKETIAKQKLAQEDLERERIAFNKHTFTALQKKHWKACLGKAHDTFTEVVIGKNKLKFSDQNFQKLLKEYFNEIGVNV